MSIHSSLRSGGKGKKHRSVLKRYERLKVLKDKHIWDEGKSVLGIPKAKMQKLKVKNIAGRKRLSYSGKQSICWTKVSN